MFVYPYIYIYKCCSVCNTVFGWDFVDNFIICKRRKTDTVPYIDICVFFSLFFCFFLLFFEINKNAPKRRGRYETGDLFFFYWGTCWESSRYENTRTQTDGTQTKNLINYICPSFMACACAWFDGNVRVKWSRFTAFLLYNISFSMSFFSLSLVYHFLCLEINWEEKKKEEEDRSRV